MSDQEKLEELRAQNRRRAEEAQRQGNAGSLLPPPPTSPPNQENPTAASNAAPTAATDATAEGAAANPNGLVSAPMKASARRAMAEAKLREQATKREMASGIEWETTPQQPPPPPPAPSSAPGAPLPWSPAASHPSTSSAAAASATSAAGPPSISSPNSGGATRKTGTLGTVNSWIRQKSAAVAKKLKEGREGDFSAPPPPRGASAPPRGDNGDADGDEGDDANKSPTTRRAGRRRDKVRPSTARVPILLVF